MIKHGLKTVDQTYLSTVWVGLLSSLIDRSLSNIPRLLCHSYRTKIIIQLLCDGNWMKEVTDKQTLRQMDGLTKGWIK